jgi:hypothetical protein
MAAIAKADVGFGSGFISLRERSTNMAPMLNDGSGLAANKPYQLRLCYKRKTNSSAIGRPEFQ